MPAQEPSFDEWVDYCFTRAHADFGAYARDDDARERSDRFGALDITTVARHLVRLFRSPAFIADQYTDDQIGAALWFLFGIGSGYFTELRDDAVPRDLQADCMASVSTLYAGLLDHVCCRRGTDPDSDYSDGPRLDVAVYMIWDMDCIEGGVAHTHLVNPGFEVLATVLKQCRTSTCRISALHGLGHLHRYHSDRVERIIDQFLTRDDVPDWLRGYATRARTGMVL